MYNLIFSGSGVINCIFIQGNFELGVHIADVSYFVGEDNALDSIASRRATSVYMVQKVSVSWLFNQSQSLFLSGSLINKPFRLHSMSLVSLQVIPMLPRLLCEELCSLNPLIDRLTFSVIWKITPEGKVRLFMTKQ